MATQKQDLEHDRDDVDRNVRLVVQMLMAATETEPAQLAVVLKCARNTVYERLAGNRRFTIKDLRRLADHFEVDPGVFFAEPRTLLRGPRGAGSEPTRRYDVPAGQKGSIGGPYRAPGTVSRHPKAQAA